MSATESTQGQNAQGQNPAAQKPVKRRKHLMDPNNLQRDVSNSAGITRVQTWVMSTLVVITGVHMAGGVLAAAWFIDESKTGARIGLSVIAGAFMVLTIAAALAIHKRPMLSPWLLVGLATTIAGVLWLA